MTESAKPRFWRDDALPFIEARSIEDARDVHYARHAHETFSIGAITAGSCAYWNERPRQRIGSGSVVLMNPGDAHACNPVGDDSWSYRMLYVDVPWLVNIQHDLGQSRQHRFRPFVTTATTEARLYGGLNRLYDVLTDRDADALQKHEAALAFMTSVQRTLSTVRDVEYRRHRGVERAAEFIRDNYTRALKLDEICSAAELSAPYLIRTFKDSYGMTPHAYLVNCRIEFSRSQLRKGRPIAAVAAEAGFCDQAHLQRAFKRIVAATPGQYRA